MNAYMRIDACVKRKEGEGFSNSGPARRRARTRPGCVVQMGCVVAAWVAAWVVGLRGSAGPVGQLGLLRGRGLLDGDVTRPKSERACAWATLHNQRGEGFVELLELTAGTPDPQVEVFWRDLQPPRELLYVKPASFAGRP